MSGKRFPAYPIPKPPYDEDANDSRARTGPWWDWYNGYLRSDEWEARRQAVLERADWRCEDCNAELATHAHHHTYERVGEERLSDLEALCPSCHDGRHGTFDKETRDLALEAYTLLTYAHALPTASA
jgi:5-methylcytosine-specific restriction endonuclease McrA